MVRATICDYFDISDARRHIRGQSSIQVFDIRYRYYLCCDRYPLCAVLLCFLKTLGDARTGSYVWQLFKSWNNTRSSSVSILCVGKPSYCFFFQNEIVSTLARRLHVVWLVFRALISSIRIRVKLETELSIHIFFQSGAVRISPSDLIDVMAELHESISKEPWTKAQTKNLRVLILIESGSRGSPLLVGSFYWFDKA